MTALDSPRRFLSLTAALILGVAAGPALAKDVGDAALITALRQGGYVLVMRHANAPTATPDRSTAERDNIKLERQLDESGRSAARAMGVAVKTLRIPIGDVLSSPTYRALETVRLVGLKPRIYPELDEGASGMNGNADTVRTTWLRAKAAKRPRVGTDTLIVTHAPNIAAAFGQGAASVAPGETILLKPNGKGGVDLVTRITIEKWTNLAACE